MNHVVVGNFSASAVVAAIEEAAPSAAQFETFLGTFLNATLSGDDVILSPVNTTINATVTETLEATCFGTVHVVDMVLVPGTESTTTNATGTPTASPTGSATTPPTGPATTPATSPPAVVSSTEEPNSAYTALAASGIVVFAGVAFLMV
jgi:hypothetical protein